MPRVSYYFKKNSSDGGGVNLSERDTHILTHVYTSYWKAHLHCTTACWDYSENDVAAPCLLWKLLSLIYWQPYSNLTRARKSRGKKEVNLKKAVKDISCPWFQRKNWNHMDPRNTEMPTSWAPSFTSMLQFRESGHQSQTGWSTSWLYHWPALWACGHQPPS